MATAVVVSIFSRVSAALAFWWSNVPVSALGVCFGALLLLAMAALVYELCSLDKELSALEGRVRRLVELRSKSNAADSTWPA